MRYQDENGFGQSSRDAKLAHRPSEPHMRCGMAAEKVRRPSVGGLHDSAPGPQRSSTGRGVVWAKSQLPDLRAADTTRRTGTPTPFKALLGSKPEPLIHLAEEKENYNV